METWPRTRPCGIETAGDHERVQLPIVTTAPCTGRTTVMAYPPGADPPDRVTEVRRTTWVGVPPAESISTSSGASCPVTTAPASGAAGATGAPWRPTTRSGVGRPRAGRRSTSRGLPPPGRAGPATGQRHGGIDQVHGAHGRLVLFQGQALRLQGTGRRRRVVRGGDRPHELRPGMEARALGGGAHLRCPHEEAVRGEEERVGGPAGVEHQARTRGVRHRRAGRDDLLGAYRNCTVVHTVWYVITSPGLSSFRCTK